MGPIQSGGNSPLHHSRLAGIGLGATLVLVVYTIARLSAHPIMGAGLGDAAFCVAVLAVVVWLLCVLVALIANRMHGL